PTVSLLLQLVRGFRNPFSSTCRVLISTGSTANSDCADRRFANFDRQSALSVDRARDGCGGRSLSGRRRIDGTRRTVVQHRCRQSSAGDRKSTRLNSSHVAISYAVFCLKKKKNKSHTAKGL